MILDTKDKLEIALPFLKASENTTFLALEPFIQAKIRMYHINLFGSAFSLLELEDEKDINLLSTASVLVAAHALLDAIPTLDLILTPNGFGIVSTDGIAPASKARVQALKQQCIDFINTNYMLVLAELYNNQYDIWKDEMSTVENNISSLVFLNEHFYFSKSTTQGILYENKTKLLEINQTIDNIISMEYHSYLMSLVLTKDTIPECDAKLIKEIRLAISFFFVGKALDAMKLLHQVNASLENDINNYPAYADSILHKAKQTTSYENSKEKSCFFF